jgi:phenylpyruvate tautomerase PptA (4-oxalocrotonate tautomerase family)
MPIIDVELVVGERATTRAGLAQRLADAAARVLDAPPGRVWVRLRELPAGNYAENAVDLAAADLPAFVTVLHAKPPTGPALAEEATALGIAVAGCLGVPPERVHVEYAPPGSGRVAFGGALVR